MHETDPAESRKADKRAARLRAENTFNAVAREWWELKKSSWSEAHAEAIKTRLEKLLFPTLGHRPIAEIEAPELLDTLRAIERRDAPGTGIKDAHCCGHGISLRHPGGQGKSRPGARSAQRTQDAGNAALREASDADLPEFLRKLDAYDGNTVTKLAIKLLALTFVRTGELRGARWSEFDFEKAEWRIPAERMKTRAQHLVPLSQQAMAVLEQLKPITGEREYLLRTFVRRKSTLKRGSARLH